MRARAREWAGANPLLLAGIGAGLAARIAYWGVADRRLDDAMITIKHAKNVADGAGFTHHLGEGGPVHGFTSVLSSLVPLPGELVADGGGLLVIRLVSLAAFVVAMVYANRIGRELGFGPWPLVFVFGYLALDQNQVFYGTAGMETQIAVAVLLVGAYYVLVEDFARSGVWLGLALLARPDFVLWVAPAFVFLLIRSREGAARTWLFGAAVVVPWLIFATLYYGSPIPNTVIAKSQAFPTDLPPITAIGDWLDFTWEHLKAHKGDWATIAPFLERAFIVDTPFSTTVWKLVSWVVLALAAVGAVRTWRRPSWRPAIVFVLLWIAYKFVFLTIGYFEWYGMPALAILVILAGAGLQWLTAGRGLALVAVPATVLALAYAIQLPFTLPLERRVQEQIEDPVRDQLGRYLGEVTREGETIVTEPAGYVGYYTNTTLLDFPGLTSTTVTDAVDEHPEFNTLPGLVTLLQPDWLVLRPGEVDFLEFAYPDDAARYREVKRFAVSEEDSRLELGGLSIHNADREFIVLRRAEG